MALAVRILLRSLSFKYTAMWKLWCSQSCLLDVWLPLKCNHCWTCNSHFPQFCCMTPFKYAHPFQYLELFILCHHWLYICSYCKYAITLLQRAMSEYSRKQHDKKKVLYHEKVVQHLQGQWWNLRKKREEPGIDNERPPAKYLSAWWKWNKLDHRSY